MRTPAPPDFFGRTREELQELFARELPDVPKFRAAQVYCWLYARRARSFAEMSDLPKVLQAELKKQFKLPTLALAHLSESIDGTRKFLFELADGLKIEAVLIPSEMLDARDEVKRKTLCVSTQVGCPLDCKFCATASLKLKRNLTTAEILLQVFEVERLTGESITNLVFMGMGEPMLNLEHVARAIRILTDPENEILGKRRITVSTSGLPDAIREFTRMNLGVKLALSLHATTNELRSRIMPINRRYPLEEVLAAMEDYYQQSHIPVTYEYIVFRGLNDGPADAKRLAKITRRCPSKVNVIPFHPIDFTHPEGISAELAPAPKAEFERFLTLLRAEGVRVMVRSSSGVDIEAACGQLALAEETPVALSLP
ncbi:MAG: 23S rRNA (adenine(2503)-C(2))-methyltransferase RlmN [Bacteroidota bacterium]|nr:23S rRNA (adenine(2503)-C(2))-methyltransferase RlmN [Bacteroidota bacterium]MDP4234081.1 23S rRNA (adenine(2503)-C(2))-methyltransferase RlmN [Bacteroidota bacterium]MDP4243022.1 23S rRNA (adenine(2503)-C(2))-methyltransferase RlmN [Bacteroidota bacterium]MDP4287448.1 23S rRNA (adenine(2503)-C(2))-methyltransferase RlmN [Bacteroidota bacterium]